ncbi:MULTISPECIES: hypothetical protein [unclassified Gordonia (in: high G+C Gram-positive bacteria)]|uniref:hypothetical protein n=1 Tax=unclassified Gordonia (in: high G+C Gram-positive bacteria) TaxID=2657482 RepID=UPI0001DDAA6A|nr:MULTISPECIES: hypothetical protein [unclassified Gordonia (in: high G+C Gram-positive bacteria)]ADK68903.1 hypothetical protein KTR9_4822 [Gordonia sp. KTR9]
MINLSILTLVFALIVVCVLGGWALISLLLVARRDTAVEDLVSAHQDDGSSTEQGLIEEIQILRATTRERQTLLGCGAVVTLFVTVIGYFIVHALISLSQL